jgi:hypothetical protein
MGITAEEGPLVTFGQAVSPPNSSNPEIGPSAWIMGDMILDPRAPFTFQPGQRGSQPTYGWGTANAIPLIDQVPSAVATNNIVAAQAPTANTPLTLVSSSGAGITVGCAITNAGTNTAVTGLLGIDVNSATAPQPPVNFGTGGAGAGGPMNIWNPLWAVSRCVAVQTNADDTGGFYTVAGYDIYGFPMSQKLTGVNSATVKTTKAFKYIASVTPSGTINSTSVNIGTTDTYGLPLRTDRAPYLQVWWGTPQAVLGGYATFDLELPVQFADWTTSAATFNIDPGFDGLINSMTLRVGKVGAGSGASQILTSQVAGTSTTGGSLTATLTNTSTGGASVAGSAITAGNTFTASQAIGYNITAGGTVFTGGDGVVELNVTNNDVAGGAFVGAVTTSPATQTTGDVRGTITTPSASDGTKRLTVFWTPLPSNLTTTAGLVGVTQV